MKKSFFGKRWSFFTVSTLVVASKFTEVGMYGWAAAILVSGVILGELMAEKVDEDK